MRSYQKASVLILSLWTVSFLAFLAVRIGLQIRQRAALLSRIEDHSRQYYAARAGIYQAIAALRLDFARHKGIYSADGKYFRHNNPSLFKSIQLGAIEVDVSYTAFGSQQGSGERRYGFIDEERKINLNTAEARVLKRLIDRVTELDEDRVRDIVDAILDWRQIGKTQAEGFYSDHYYETLPHPYTPKDADFELIEELLLLKGIDESVFQKIKPFLTVYGKGAVNINTASAPVLYALGLSGELVEKILQVRRGMDNEEHTQDDHVFQKTFDIAAEMKPFVALELSEIKQIDRLNRAGKLTTNSFFYYIESRAVLQGNAKDLVIHCVYNILENKVEYWREK